MEIFAEPNEPFSTLELYCKNVINRFFPEFKIETTNRFFSFIDSENEEYKNIDLPGSYPNSCLLNTPYFLDTQKEFIHYTSLGAVINILNEGLIRLSSAGVVNDPLEISFAKNYIGKPKENWWSYLSHCDDPDQDIDDTMNSEIKSLTFILSLCEIVKDQPPDRFDMWRMYGNAGHGVALVLEIDDDNRVHWLNSHLSQVYYGVNEQLELLSEFIKQNNSYVDTEKTYFNNMDRFLNPFLAFHKSGYYANEKEIRLLVHYTDSQSSDPEEDKVMNMYKSIPYLSNQNTLETGLGIYLKTRTDQTFELGNKIPTLKIKKGILGYQFDDSQCAKIKRSIDSICLSNSYDNIEVERTYLREELGFK